MGEMRFGLTSFFCIFIKIVEKRDGNDLCASLIIIDNEISYLPVMDFGCFSVI